MPKFVKNGPEIPVELLTATEEDKVVFFCGAGLSRNAGLPDFRKLALECSRLLGADTLPDVRDWLKQYDPTDATCSTCGKVSTPRQVSWERFFDILENHFKRDQIDTALFECLKSKSGANLTSHADIMRLSTTSKNKLRLITTNFDRLFDEAYKTHSLTAEKSIRTAPALPEPRGRDQDDGGWSGLIYMHGALPITGSGKDSGSELIYTSKDFGRAYLTEGWATRFVARLIREYTVVFIGYSFADPFIGYMASALQAEKITRSAHGAAAYIFSNEANPSNLPEGLVKIFFDNPDGRYSLLWKTLSGWAETKQDHAIRQRLIITQNCIDLNPDKVDLDSAEWVKWAIYRGDVGLKLFNASHKQIPISWLWKMLKWEESSSTIDKQPVPQLISGLLCYPNQIGILHNNSYLLFPWIIYNLSNKELINWVAESYSRGRRLHPSLRDRISIRLNEGLGLAKFTHLFWRIITVLDHYLWSGERSHRMHPDPSLGLTNDLYWLETFRPVIKIENTRYRDFYPKSDDDDGSKELMSDVFSAEVIFNIEYPEYVLSDLRKSPNYKEFIARNNTAIDDLLTKALTYLALFEKERSTSYSRPSIAQHEQNRYHAEWTILIELVRDAWEELNVVEPEVAKAKVNVWKISPYSIHKRLAAYSVCKAKSYSLTEKIEFLVNYCLPQDISKKETFDLICEVLAHADDTQRVLIEVAILKDISSEYERIKEYPGISPPEAKKFVDRHVYERLALIEREKGLISPEAQDKLKKLKTEYPEWEIPDGERAHFSSWMGPVSWAPSERALGSVEKLVEMTNEEIIKLITDYQIDGFSDLREWKKFSTKKPVRVINILLQYAKNDDCRIEYFSYAAEGISDAKGISKLIPFFYKQYPQLLPKLRSDENFLGSVAGCLLSSVKRYSYSRTSLKIYEFLVRDCKLLKIVIDKNPVQRALNSPARNLTDFAMHIFYESKPKVGDGVKSPIKEIFDTIFMGDDGFSALCRVSAVPNLNSLVNVDVSWTTGIFLKRLSWKESPADAQAMWSALAYGVNISDKFWDNLLSESVFDTMRPENIEKLEDKEAENIYGLIPLVILHIPSSVVDLDKLKETLAYMRSEGLASFLKQLWRMMELKVKENSTKPDDIGKRRRADRLWQTRVSALLDEVWPLKNSANTPKTSLEFAHLLAGLNQQFGNAFSLAKRKGWLQKTTDNYPSLLIHFLVESEIAEKFPEELLEFLNLVLSDAAVGTSYMPELKSLFDRAEKAGASKDTAHYKWLRDTLPIA